MEKKRDNLGSTWRPVQRLGGQLLTQFLTRSRRGWWVRSSGSIDLGYKLRSPQSIRPFRCLWADLTGFAFQTTSESFTFTDDSNGDTFYVCKANLDFAIRVTTGQSKLERVWKIKQRITLAQLSGREKQHHALPIPQAEGSWTAQLPTSGARLVLKSEDYLIS